MQCRWQEYPSRKDGIMRREFANAQVDRQIAPQITVRALSIFDYHESCMSMSNSDAESFSPHEGHFPA